MTARQIAAEAAALTRWMPHAPDRRRLPFALLLLGLLSAPGAVGDVARSALFDAYIGVTVFVAATLMLFYGLEKALRIDTAAAMSQHRFWQVPAAAALGALPGCGGAIIVVSAYSRGHIGFGAVIATLTATMGDAAFLLIATRPDTAALLIPITLVVGILSGWTADAFLENPMKDAGRRACALPAAIGRLRLRDIIFMFFAAPGLVFGVLALMQIDAVNILGSAVEDLALAGIAAAVLIWAFSPISVSTRSTEHVATRTAEETSFVTVWVVTAFLLYDFGEAFLGIDPTAVTTAAAPFVPLLAILVGFIPGCGPQLVMTTLYINGAVPFAALIGNAISNDGDALFPALAVDRKAAILATLYSAIPAVIVAYGFLLAGFNP